MQWSTHRDNICYFSSTFNGQFNFWWIGKIHDCIMTAECPHGAGQEPGMQRREQSSVRIRIAERKCLRWPGRSGQLFPPGSGSGGIWIKLCWGVTQGGDTGNELGKCLQLWSQICILRLLWVGPSLVTCLDTPEHFSFLLQLLLSSRPWRPWVLCITLPSVSPLQLSLSLIPDTALELITMFLVWHHSLTPPDTW